MGLFTILFVFILSTLTGFQTVGDVISRSVPVLSDAYVRGGIYNLQNYGNSEHLVIKSSINPDFSRESYLNFNTSSLFLGNNCTLSLPNLVINPHTNLFQIYLGYVNSSWSENSLIWNNKPKSYNRIGPISITGPVNISIHDFVQQSILQNNGQLSLHLYQSGIGSTDKLEFDSRETGIGGVVECVFPKHIIINVVEDSFVRGGQFGNTNYGSDDKLIVKSSTNPNFIRESYLKFNTKGLYPHYNCKLKLYNSITSSFLIQISKTHTSWNESTITYNNKPGSIQNLVPIIINQGNISIDISSLIQSDKISLNIRTLNQTNDKLEFWSKEGMIPPQVDCTIDEESTCTDGWKITGYFTPIESEYPNVLKTVMTDMGLRIFRKQFLDNVETEGWGKTLQSDYVGFYDGGWHIHHSAVDSRGNVLTLYGIAVDPDIIPFDTQVTIPNLPSPFGSRIYTATDIGAVQGQGDGIFGKEIDVFCGEGSQAEQYTFTITTQSTIVCILP